MRAEMAAHKPANGPYDIKLGDGGLVDLEFAVQVLQLRHRTGLHPQLDRAVAELAAPGLIPPGLEHAHRLLTRMPVTFSLVSPDPAPPTESTRPPVATGRGMADWDCPYVRIAHPRPRVIQHRREI